MDKKMFRHIFEMQIKKEFGEDFSFATHEYVHHRKYRRHRVGGRVLGREPEGKPQLYTIIHEIITNEERKKIFPGVFDLGNFREVQTELCKYTALEKEIFNETGISAHEVLKTIKKRTGDLLGKKFNIFFEENKSKSLKVLKTLYRFQREYTTIFTLLTHPEKSGKPSYEVRDSYGICAAKEEVDIIADLKTHLSFEIQTERLKSISRIHGQLRSVLDGIENMLIQQAVILSKNNREIFLTFMDFFSNCVEKTLEFDIQKPVHLPLDENFYIYLIQLEFRHHAAANLNVFDAVISSPLPFVESWREIGRLMGDIGFKKKSAQYVSLSIEKIKHEFIINKKYFIPFYCKLLKIDIREEIYSEAIPLFEKILKVFSHTSRKEEIDFINAISAMSLVLTEIYKSTPYKPFWYGQRNISGGLIEFLNNASFDYINLNSPEGSARYWVGRLEYFSSAIVGHAYTYEAAAKFSRYINICILRILDTQDTSLLDKKLSLLVSTNGGTILE